MFCALFIPNYRLQAALRYRPEMWQRPVAVIDSWAVVELTATAVRAGVETGMSPTQAQARCMELTILSRAPETERVVSDTLLGVGCAASAYVEQTAENIVTLDLQGLRIQDHKAWAMALMERAGLAEDYTRDTRVTLGLCARAGIAQNPDLACMAARVADPVQVVEDSTAFLADLPLAMLVDGDAEATNVVSVLAGWGIGTLGGLARLKRNDVAARLGPAGVRLWERARGQSTRLLRLMRPPERYEEAFDFERELETAQPLLFLLRRFVDALTLRLEAAGLVASELSLTLLLSNGTRYERLFRIPSPTANADVLFRILDTHFENLRLEHPPTGVRLTVEPVKPEHQQFRMFENAVRDPNRFAETLARVMAVVGSGNAGVPEMKPTHQPDQFALTTRWLENPSAPIPNAITVGQSAGLPLRRFRPPFPARVHVEEGRPRSVVSDKARGTVVDILGPYRLSGKWWENAWSAEEWDVQMSEGGLYRLSRHGELWQVEGCYD